jgi:catechol 2,3-dioxygenase
VSGIASDTTVGPVSLTVADLDRSLRWYAHALGLEPTRASNGGGVAALGAGGDDLLVLHEEPGALPVQHHTGLYHYALLVPTRSDLARWLARVAQDRIPLTGLSDHIVSEAIYLRDPDGHGIEIYRDRPRDEWIHDGDEVRLSTDPIDVEDLLGAAEGAPTGVPEGTRMGHVHLHVSDIPAAAAFYRDTLGFDETAHLGNQASFFSAGGYHHHVGVNTWAGVGATPPPPGSAALRHATVVLPDPVQRGRVVDRAADAGAEPVEVEEGVLVRDPSQNALVLTTA